MQRTAISNREPWGNSVWQSNGNFNKKNFGQNNSDTSRRPHDKPNFDNRIDNFGPRRYSNSQPTFLTRNNNYNRNEDVSMRTAPQRSASRRPDGGPIINLGNGRTAQELFHNDYPEDFQEEGI